MLPFQRFSKPMCRLYLRTRIYSASPPPPHISFINISRYLSVANRSNDWSKTNNELSKNTHTTNPWIAFCSGINFLMFYGALIFYGTLFGTATCYYSYYYYMDFQSRRCPCVLKQFAKSKPEKLPRFVLDRSTPLMKTVKSIVTPKPDDKGIVIFTGRKFIGKTTLFKTIFNQIKTEDPSAPIIYVDLCNWRSNAFVKALNAFYYDENKYFELQEEEGFRVAKERLAKQLCEGRNAFYDRTPVLIIDGLRRIPDDLFAEFTLLAKKLSDNGHLKTVLVASDGIGKQKLKFVDSSRVVERMEIQNDFDEREVESYLHRQEIKWNRSGPYFKALMNISQGGIGYIDHVVRGREKIKQSQRQQDIEQDMLRVLFEFDVSRRLIGAFEQATQEAIAKGKVQMLSKLHALLNPEGNFMENVIGINDTEFRDIVLKALEDNNVFTRVRKTDETMHDCQWDYECHAIALMFENKILKERIEKWNCVRA